MRAALAWCIAVGAAGCAQTRVTDSPRTATEQFLLSRAASEAVNQLSFDVLRGRRVYIDTEYFAASEQAFVLGELRARLLLSGVQLARDLDDAQVIVEVRSSGVGIDRNDFLLGVPSVGAVTPELVLVKNREQRGIAGVSYVAYWRETGEVVAASGPFTGRSLRDDWWFFGYGPRSSGNIPPIRKAQ